LINKCKKLEMNIKIIIKNLNEIKNVIDQNIIKAYHIKIKILLKKWLKLKKIKTNKRNKTYKKYYINYLRLFFIRGLSF